MSFGPHVPYFWRLKGLSLSPATSWWTLLFLRYLFVQFPCSCLGSSFPILAADTISCSFTSSTLSVSVTCCPRSHPFSLRCPFQIYGICLAGEPLLFSCVRPLWGLTSAPLAHPMGALLHSLPGPFHALFTPPLLQITVEP